MDRWEYKSIKVNTKGFFGGILEQQDFDNEINIMGSQGWELVSCFDTNETHGATKEVVAVFKRKINV